MRVFVGEYICGGGLAAQPLEEIPESLRREGIAMLRAITEDLLEFSDVLVPVDPRFTEIGLPDAATTLVIDPQESLWSQWSEAAQVCDSAIIVAPEIDGVLAKSVAALRAAGVDVIAGSGDFLRTASDKLLTAKALRAAGVSQPPYMALSDRRFENELSSYSRFVVKPRDGCGTQQIRLYDSLDEAKSELEENSILQGWMTGDAVSIAMVASPNQRLFLPSVHQDLSSETCEYRGGSGPLNDDAQRRLTALAMRTIASLPPTVRGFVGFDMLLGEQPSDDCVIEVNPRLTTSYVGLRKMIRGNLASRLFDIETGPVACSTGIESVRWTPDGRVWIDTQAVSSNEVLGDSMG